MKVKRSITVLASILLFSAAVSAQNERSRPAPRIQIVYILVSQLIETCSSPESTLQNRCNGYVYGVIDALDATGLSCPGHHDPKYFGPRIKQDITQSNSDTHSQPAGSVIVSLLKAYGCHIPSGDNGTTGQDSSQVEAAPGCIDVEAYKDKAPAVDYYDALQIWLNIFQCDVWAEEHADKKMLHDSFSALNHLYTQQSSALEEQLWTNKNAPASCKVFQDYQKASHDAMEASFEAKLSKTEALEKVTRAEEGFLAPFRWNGDGEESKTVNALFDCAKWARDSNQTVIAFEVRQLVSELYEADAGSLPADIEKVAPVCKNASSEADAILEFVGKHVGDNRIMPSDVYTYFARATPVSSCAAQLAKTRYRSAYEHLLLAVLEINNLMVIADDNSEMKLIHTAPPSQPGSPIVIKIQSSSQQNQKPNHCTGTVLNLGSISSVDWNCN